MKPRRTVRVFVFDEAGRVLLIRCAMVLKSGEDFVFTQVTPGGEIEPGEEPRDAAVRGCGRSWGWSLSSGPLYAGNRFEQPAKCATTWTTGS